MFSKRELCDENSESYVDTSVIESDSSDKNLRIEIN